jgi:hypothetical protein
VVFEVSFIPDRRFSFVLRRTPKEHRHNFTCTEAPGEKFLTPQSSFHDEIQTAFSRFDRWLERIREELISANPFAREIASLRKHVEERISSIEEDLDGFFSVSETSALSSRLEELAARLVELETQNEKLEGDVSALTRAVQDLKDAATVVNKGTWYRMASGRLLAGLKSIVGAKETREFALEAAKKFLLEGPK